MYVAINRVSNGVLSVTKVTKKGIFFYFYQTYFMSDTGFFGGKGWSQIWIYIFEDGRIRIGSISTRIRSPARDLVVYSCNQIL